MSVKVTSFTEFWDAWQEYRGGKWVFRGVADSSYQLVPKVGRSQKWAECEHRMLDHFSREAVALESNTPTEGWEFLAIAQHHGLPTRLLDWTENPLVAAFFSANEHYDRDGVIYLLKTPFRVAPGKDDPFSMTHVARYRPHHVSTRIHAQRGLFTVHPDPTEPLSEGANGQIEVAKIVVSKDFKEQLLWDLTRVG
ncbi:MAG: FRG domain-containing protein, partial [Verrucomicrobiota bacterium]